MLKYIPHAQPDITEDEAEEEHTEERQEPEEVPPSERQELDPGEDAADVLQDLDPLPDSMEEAATMHAERSGLLEDGITAEGSSSQEALQDRFAEKRQIPPVRAGIMVLLTLGEICASRATVYVHCCCAFPKA